jgi:hypothetical protein
MKTFEKAGIKYRRTFEALKDLRLNAENPPVFKEIRRMFSLPSAAT